jgi:hypothetical protein
MDAISPHKTKQETEATHEREIHNSANLRRDKRCAAITISLANVRNSTLVDSNAAHETRTCQKCLLDIAAPSILPADTTVYISFAGNFQEACATHRACRPRCRPDMTLVWEQKKQTCNHFALCRLLARAFQCMSISL